MILATILSMLLAGAPAQSAAPQQSAPSEAPAGQQQCGSGLNVQLAHGLPAKATNVVLARSEESSPEDACARNLKPDEYIRLHESIVPVATKAFAGSQATFGVMVRYTLSPDKPASFRMQVANAPETEKQRLATFYRQASAMTDFHSTSGIVNVLFEFDITPAPPVSTRKHTKAS